MDPQSFELTLEQQFHMAQLREDSKGLSREQALSLLLDAVRLAMVKDNIIRDLIKNQVFQPSNIL